MTETEHKNIISFVIEKKENEHVFIAELMDSNGDATTIEAPSMSGNIFLDDVVIGGFDDPVVFELYYIEDTKIEKIISDRAQKDDSVYFDLYLKA